MDERWCVTPQEKTWHSCKLVKSIENRKNFERSQLVLVCCQLTLTSISRLGASGIRGYMPTARMQPSRRASTCLLQRNFGFAVTCCHQVRNVLVGVHWVALVPKWHLLHASQLLINGFEGSFINDFGSHFPTNSYTCPLRM